MKLLLLLVAVSGLQAAHSCTTCYIDYVDGSDSNDGAAKTTGGGHGPWRHAPGMLGLTTTGTSTEDGCTSTCASQVPVAGDRYILRGGTIWPYTTLPWLWTWGGTSTTSGTYGCAGSGCIYIGYDPTWNLGIVNAVTLQRDLGGCASTPTVSFSGGGGSGATATAAVMPSSVQSVEPNVYGFVTYVTITNQGSGYTSNPTVTISGGGCTQVNAVADIYRPIIDAGLNSGIDWPVGFGTGSLNKGPGLTVTKGYLIIDHLEYRNILQQARNGGSACNQNPDGVLTGILYDDDTDGTGHITFSNNYLHGRQTDTDTVACENQEGEDRFLLMYNATDEASGNYLSNGDQLRVGNGTTYRGSGQPYVFSNDGIFDVGGGWTHGNYITCANWMINMGGTSSIPIQVNNNEVWLTLYSQGTTHTNEEYTLLTTGTAYWFNNVFHSAVSGASNQQQQGNGTTQYWFNNVWWGGGSGTPPWGIDTTLGAGPNPSNMKWFNNTIVSNGPGTGNCVASGSGGSYKSALIVTLQNNHCITNLAEFWGDGSGGVSIWQDFAGLTALANVEGANAVQTLATATSQGYVTANLFAPTASSNGTVAFASGGTTMNLTSVCSGVLVALCSDINGNARPTTGGWQAGAYVFTPPTAPPTLLTVIVQ